MASTYTTRLGLEKQTDGENPNSWGAILNTNVIDLIDDAIAGYEIVSVSSTGITLTDNQGSTDQSRNAALEFAGTLTANVTITVPAEEKTYFIRENTSGSFAVQMKTVGGTALTLSQGENTFVACNGTSIYRIDAPTSVTSFTATSITTNTLIANTNVGIGSVNALDKLHVYEEVNSAIATQLLLQNQGAGSHAAGIAFQVTTSAEAALTVYAPKAAIIQERNTSYGRGPIKFMQDNAADADPFGAGDEVMRIDPSGNVGINTLSPVKKLHVDGPALATIGTLTDGATITPDFDANQNFSVTLGGNRTLANPSNIDAGQTGSIFVVQDGTGSRTLSFGAYWKFPGGTAPTLSTAAAAVDRIDYIVYTATAIQAIASLNIS